MGEVKIKYLSFNLFHLNRIKFLPSMNKIFTVLVYLFGSTCLAQSILIEPQKLNVNTSNNVSGLAASGRQLLFQEGYLLYPNSTSLTTLINNAEINLTDIAGRIVDPNGSSNYLQNTIYNARVRFNPTIPSENGLRGLELSFNSLDLGTGDTLQLYRDNAYSQLIAAYTGSTIPENLLVNLEGNDELYLRFKANGDAQVGAGFDINYRYAYSANSGISGSRYTPVLGGSTLLFNTTNGSFKAGTFNKEDILEEGSGSFAGISGRALGRNSVAIGDGALASETGAFAFGERAEATGRNAVAFGSQNLGAIFPDFKGNVSSGDASMSFNGGGMSYNKAIGSSSTAFGRDSEAIGLASISAGNITKAEGNYSMAMGEGTRAGSYAMAAFGRYNVDVSSPASWSAGTPLFVIGNGSSSTNRNNAFTLLKNGRIGVDIALPTDAKLRINHLSSVSDSHITLFEEENDFARLTFKNTLNTGSWTIAGRARDGGNPGYLNFYYSNPGMDIMQIESFSTYGIVRVNGQLRVSENAILSGPVTQTNDFYSTSNISARGTVCASNISCSSDIRLKTNLEKLAIDWDNLQKLNAFHYNWKETDRGAGLQTGLVAQEVQEVLPHLVNTDKNGYLSVNYIALTPYLLEAVKDLKKENEALKQAIFEIKAMLNASK